MSIIDTIAFKGKNPEERRGRPAKDKPVDKRPRISFAVRDKEAQQEINAALKRIKRGLFRVTPFLATRDEALALAVNFLDQNLEDVLALLKDAYFPKPETKMTDEEIIAEIEAEYAERHNVPMPTHGEVKGKLKQMRDNGRI
jgi:hypothetical protein